jgi:hypothetical protein
MLEILEILGIVVVGGLALVGVLPFIIILAGRWCNYVFDRWGG